MPGGKGDWKAMEKALRRKKLTRVQLRLNAERVIALARRLHEAREQAETAEKDE